MKTGSAEIAQVSSPPRVGLAPSSPLPAIVPDSAPQAASVNAPAATLPETSSCRRSSRSFLMCTSLDPAAHFPEAALGIG